jgi:hypothetical protein
MFNEMIATQSNKPVSLRSTLPVNEEHGAPILDRTLRSEVIDAYERQVCDYKLPLQVLLGLMRAQLFRDAISAERRVMNVLNANLQSPSAAQELKREVRAFLGLIRCLRSAILDESTALRSVQVNNES